MARTKQEKEQDKLAQQETVETNEMKEAPVTSGPSYEDLMKMVQQLAGEIQTLKTQNPQTVQTVSASSPTDELINLLANRKADREVTVMHNMEMNGGLTTHIVLSSVTIDFRHVGEQRILTWQQFEECVSKYHSFFDKGILMLGPEDGELAERYGVPCVKEKVHALTSRDIAKLPKMTPRELEDFVESLSDNDKEVVFSYWLGKCYERKEGFYDRYKMDVLNRLSKDGCFNNILLVMNGESIIDNEK